MPNENLKPLTKPELLTAIATKAGSTKQVVESVLDSLVGVIREQVGAKGPGTISILGMLKIDKVEKPAKPEREGLDPFTKQVKTFKAKPASNTVKLRALKVLKDMVEEPTSE